MHVVSPGATAGDAAARERIRNSLDESLLVEASAGTGKTTELTNRMVRLLATGRAEVGAVVAVTFTHKAAGELKIRVRQGLDDARATASDPVERANLERALAHLEEAFIGTIHSFCAEILRQRPVEACVDPAFEEMEASQSERLFSTAFDEWFQAGLASGLPGLRRALARLAWPVSWEDSPPLDRLRAAATALKEWRDFPCRWRREMFPLRQRIIELRDQIDRVHKLRVTCHNGKDSLYLALGPVTEFTVRTFEYWGQSDSVRQLPEFDTIEALLVRLQKELVRNSHTGFGQKYGEGVPRNQMIAERDALNSALQDFVRRADADLASVLRDELQGAVDGYERLKASAGKLDFTDLLLRVRNLVRDDHAVRRHLQRRYTHLFVDEFQDTDPLQMETLLLLAADDPDTDSWLDATPAPGKLFLVGDPKQSIYKFRRADVTLYQTIARLLKERGIRTVHLTKSFRSVRPIQEFVNRAFAPLMTGDPISAQADYAPLEEHTPGNPNQPSIVALPVPRPYGKAQISKQGIDNSLPGAVGAYVEWLIRESGWQVRDPEDPSRLTPIAARHIAILFRRFANFGNDMTRGYVKALEARGLPHLLVGSRSFHAREEVETLRAALNAVEWPDDELSVFAVLRGPLFAIDDETLFRYRLEVGHLHPFGPAPPPAEKPLPEMFAPVREVLELLARLHRRRNNGPLAETVMGLLEAARAHAGFALRPAGHQVVANVNRIADLARNFEFSGGISFRGFVEELAHQADRSESSEAPVFEYAADGVRLMTVHNAKGLEFPVVILGDISANLTARRADRYIDNGRGLCAMPLLSCSPWELLEHEAEEMERQRAEGVRVAYVAATRAKDLLVVPAVGDKPYEGWVGPLNDALYPPRQTWRAVNESGPGCPQFRGDRTVLERPQKYWSDPEDSVRPGLHGSVVWWDPAALRLEQPEPTGLLQEEILTATQPAARESEEAFRNWQMRRASALDRGAVPSLELVLASTSGAPPPGVPEPRVESVGHRSTSEDSIDRPRGPRFGTLVHTILRHVHNEDEMEHWALTAGAQLQAPVDEVAAAMEAVRAALHHPLLIRAGAAAESHREMPVTLRIDEQRLLEGVIDLAFFEPGRGWSIVDFKTTQDLASHRATYAAQLQWYAHAVQQISGHPVESWILAL